MIDQIYQSEINKNLDDQQARPGPQLAPTVPLFKNFLGGFGGFVAGPNQGAAAWADILHADSGIMTATSVNGAGGMFSTPSDAEQKQIDAARNKLMTEGPDMNSQTGRELRATAKDYLPDPQSTGKAGQILGSLSTFASQAIPEAAVGPPGLVALGVTRGVQKADELREQGVDVNTRTAAGAVSGAFDAATMLLPMTGPTRLIAAGKGAAGGAAANIGQTEAEKLILQHSGYDKLASTYDPLDPTSIALSALVPAAFGGLHAPTPRAVHPGASPELAAAQAATDAARNDTSRIPTLEAEIAKPETTAASKTALQAEIDRLRSAPQQLDPNVEAAARVTQTAEAIDRSRLTPDDDLVGREQHVRAVESASDQIALGAPVDISDVVSGSEMDLARTNAMRDRLNDTTAMHPAADDVHIAKLELAAQETLRGMYADAAREKAGFDTTLGHLAGEVGGKAMPAPLKGTARATSKIISDYEGNPGRIKDLLRATIEVHSADAAARVIAGIRERYGISGERNLLDPGKTSVDGYRDAKFNVDVNGHTAEIQVNMPQMMAAKKIAHKLYEKREAITREANARGEKVLPAEVDDLNAKMRAIYEPAWAEALAATSERNAASEIGAPLRRAESEGNDRGAGGSQATQREGPTPAPSDTGIPSTSKNSARGGNLAGRESGADFIGTSSESLHLEAVSRAADEILRTNPDLMVQLEGMDQPMRAEDLLNSVREAAAEAARDASLLEVAAQCAISL